MMSERVGGKMVTRDPVAEFCVLWVWWWVWVLGACLHMTIM